MESKEEINYKYRSKREAVGRKFNRVVIAALTGAIGIAWWASINELRNPYNKTKEAQAYQSMIETASHLEYEKKIVLDNSGACLYIPESAREEARILHGPINNAERIKLLDSYITKVNTDIESIRNQPNVRLYQGWKDGHFTLDDNTFWTIFGVTGGLSISTGLAGIVTQISLAKKRSKELSELEAQTA